MSKSTDLSKLKELLSLKKSISLLGKHKTVRYNELLDWAIKTYWSVGPVKLDKYIVSVDEYYRSLKNNSYLLQGRYYFMHRFFGTRYVFLCDVLYDKESGSEVVMTKDLKTKVKALTTQYPNISFIMFVEFKNVFIIEDIVSNNNYKLYEMLDFAASIGLNVNEYLALRIEDKRIFTNNYYDLIQMNIKSVEGFYVNGLLCVREDSAIRETVILTPQEFCCIHEIKLEKITANTWLPYAITFNKKILRIQGFNSLVKAQLYIGSFVSVIKYKNILLLPENSMPESQLPKTEYLRKLMSYFNNEFFAIGNYMVKTGTTELEQIDTETGIALPYKNMEELNQKLQDKDFVDKIRSKSIFDLSCDYFLYDREKVIKLINEMDFKLDDGNKIKSFSLVSESLLNRDKSLEDIYMKFHQFVIIFNTLSTAKSMLKKYIDKP